ncbi:hypothetical protein K461DRAFT_322004 [Myriangium duriaei CBS 260.36]|uniref:Uncharacterized protein n=1 Tax=Myriangium duriaei CBS 260.36 TaxID=1168546 RepID=A0A9P4IXR5_9PEZI|nr:hypothetical protein K461DRAFT_322004 [Myriangium duriaei CBS 260.36]
MNFQSNSTMPSYCIYRDGPANEPFDPTAPLQFFPPKDSDELFFALRQAFPNVATHSERMRNAVIDFLLNEGQAQQQVASQPESTMSQEQSIHSSSTSPYSPYISLTSSASSSSASPSMFESQSPPVVNSPSNAGESSQSATKKSKPAIEQMTSVFSLSSHSQPKLRSRRKMTEAEKVEYRKRRSAGACSVCSARKRKCKHTKDQATAESSTATSSNRVSKSTSQKSRGKQPQITQPTWQQTSGSLPPSSHSQPPDQSSFLDFSSSEHNSMDPLSSFDNELFPWQTESDWTLLDMPSTDHSFPYTDAPLLSTYQRRSRTSQHLTNVTQDNLADSFFDLFTDNFGGDAVGAPSTSSGGQSAHTQSSQSIASRPVFSWLEADQSAGLQIPTTQPQQSLPSLQKHSSAAADTSVSPIRPASQSGAGDTRALIGRVDPNVLYVDSSQDGRPGASADSADIAGDHKKSQSSDGLRPVARERLLRGEPLQKRGIAASLSIDGHDPVASASVKERQSLTLQDSGQPSTSYTAGPTPSTGSSTMPSPQGTSQPAVSLGLEIHGQPRLRGAVLPKTTDGRSLTFSGETQAQSTQQNWQSSADDSSDGLGATLGPLPAKHVNLRTKHRLPTQAGLPARQEHTLLQEAQPTISSQAPQSMPQPQAGGNRQQVPVLHSEQLTARPQMSEGRPSAQKSRCGLQHQRSDGRLQLQQDAALPSHDQSKLAKCDALLLAAFMRAIGGTQWSVLCALRDASSRTDSFASLDAQDFAQTLGLGPALVPAC